MRKSASSSQLERRKRNISHRRSKDRAALESWKLALSSSGRWPRATRAVTRALNCNTSHLLIEHKVRNDFRLVPILCKSRYCPNCAAQYSRKIHQKAAGVLAGSHPRHWTLTCRNPPAGKLSLSCDALWSALHRFFALDFPDTSYIWHLEITYNSKRDDWHPHFHCLVDRYADEHDIARAWRARLAAAALSGGFVRQKSGKDKVKEVCKYVVKPGDIADDVLPLTRFAELVEALHGRRTFGSGRAYTLRITDPALDAYICHGVAEAIAARDPARSDATLWLAATRLLEAGTKQDGGDIT